MTHIYHSRDIYYLEYSDLNGMHAIELDITNSTIDEAIDNELRKINNPNNPIDYAALYKNEILRDTFGAEYYREDPILVKEII
ncbi:MAG: hypothetical protein E7314_07165 [Clostridiales bacterium]|nr:hypothetical protein [Clostridiales bacterium]